MIETGHEARRRSRERSTIGCTGLRYRMLGILLDYGMAPADWPAYIGIDPPFRAGDAHNLLLVPGEARSASLPGLIREPLQKRLCRGRGADLGAIDKVDETVATVLARLSAEAVRPTIERVRRIAGRLGFRATPQTSVDKVAVSFKRRIVVVVDLRDGDAMPPQQVGEGRRCEAPMAYFDDMANRAAVELMRQQFEEGTEAGFVESHPRRELPQDRPELVASRARRSRRSGRSRACRR